MPDRLVNAQTLAAVRRITDLACDMYAATMGNKPIYDNRDHMREYIGQYVTERLTLEDWPKTMEDIEAANFERDEP